MHVLHDVLSEQVAALKGRELKMDFSGRGGHIVHCFVAQADLAKGITIRGAYPYAEEITDNTKESDVFCLNRSKFGSGTFQTTEDYYNRVFEVMAEINAGICIVPPTKFGGQVTCAF